MRGSGGGDLVTVLSLDDFEYRTGLREASTAAQRFSGDISAVGGNRGAGFARSLQGIGFAAQDFGSVLSMGGPNALGRAIGSTMNNVQMLGAAFGPTGMAITAVAGALGTFLIPKLLEGTSIFGEMTTEVERQTKALDGYISRQQRMMDFEARLAKMRDDTQIFGAKEDLDKKIQHSEFARKTIGEQAAKTQQKIAEMRRIAEGATNTWNPFGWAAGKFTRATEIDPAIKSLEKNLEELMQKLRDAAQEEALLREQRAKLEEKSPIDKQGVEQIERQKELNELEKERARIAAQIEEKIATPYERAQKELRRLMLLTTNGTISRDTFLRAAQQTVSEYQKSQPHIDQRNAGIQSGGAAAYEAIRDSIRSSQANSDKTRDDLLKEIRDFLKKQLAESRRAPRIAARGIA